MPTSLQDPSYPRFSKLACCLLTGLIACTATSAQAVYSVINDDLYPDSVIQARNQPKETPVKITIPFAKSKSTLGPLGRAAIDILIPAMRDASILIVGRPDQTANGTRQGNLPRNRANTIRDTLIRKGVSASSITIETDDTPHSQREDGIYPSELHITRKDRTTAPYPVNNIQPEQAFQVQVTRPPSPSYPAYEPPQTSLAANPAPNATVTQTSERDKLIQFINQSMQTGHMQPAIGIQLLGTLLGADNKNNPTPIPAITTPAIVIATTPIMKWEILENDLTLQNTITRWGKQADWVIHWEDVPAIRNPGYVKLVDSDFLTAADHVLSKAKTAAKAAGINLVIKAYPNRVLIISKEL